MAAVALQRHRVQLQLRRVQLPLLALPAVPLQLPFLLVVNLDGNLGFALDDMEIGDEVAIVRQEEAGTEAAWGADLDDGLAELGFAPVELRRVGEAGFMVTRLERPCSDRYPRRTGIPEKRPLW